MEPGRGHLNCFAMPISVHKGKIFIYLLFIFLVVYSNSTNVPLSAVQTEVSTDNANVVLPYLPPHPPKGTQYHRYTLLLAEQPNGGQDKVEVQAQDVSRESTLRDLCSQYKLNVKGLTFFRQVWDKDVSRIYKEILKEDEPVYGKQPKTDELLDETGQKKKKYINL